ncbi:MAG: hypothetical protein AB7V46_17240 [Thermomicrobiales bacterium]
MIRLRVSTLEHFRKVVCTEYESEADLVERIRRGQWAPDAADTPWYMLAGTAWHRALACEPPDDAVESTEEVMARYGDYLFSPDDIYAGIAEFGMGSREITWHRDWVVDGITVRLEGTADHVVGRVVSDAKTKFSDVDPSDYEESLQWRAYLLIHDADVFRYVLFSFKDPAADGFLKLRKDGIYTFNMWRYPDLERDVLEWLNRFVGWAIVRGLLPNLSSDRKRTA